MAVSEIAFLSLLASVGILRLLELHLSGRNERRLAARGVKEVGDPHFCWMVSIHVAVLAGAALEILILRRRFHPALALAMICLLLASTAVRWWVIRTLGYRWTVHVMDAARFEVVAEGPFRYVRHPNYAAVFTELAALPLVHTAWLTAILGSAANAWVLSRRIALEEPCLAANLTYREKMAHKSRFLPGLF